MIRIDVLRGSIRAVAWGLCGLGMGLAVHAAAVPARAVVAQTLLERTFSQSLAGKPAQSSPVSDAVPFARLSVARLGIRQVVLAGGVKHALAFGPAVVRSRKAGAGVTVIAGHRDTHFRFIRDLEAGDVVSLQAVDGTTRRFQVTGFQTVRWDRFAVPADPDRPLLALSTCYPFEGPVGSPLRRVAWAEAIG